LCCAAALFLAPFLAGQFGFKAYAAEGVLAQVAGMLNGETAPLGHLAVGALLLVGLVGTAWRMRVFRLPGILLLVALLVFWFLLATSVSGARFQATARPELVRWSLMLCGFFLVAGLMGGGRLALALGGVLALAGALESLWAVREYAASARQIPDWRVFGSFFNPNMLAGYLVMVVPVCLAFLGRVGGPARWLVGLLAFLPLPALMLTGSRGGLAAGVVSVAAFLALAWWNRVVDRRLLARVGGALVVAALIFMLVSWHAGGTRIAGGGPENIEHSGSFREHLWLDTITMIRERPGRGYGLGTFVWEHGPSATVGFTRLAHNSYLQLGAECGLPAAAALLAVFALWARAVFPRERREEDGDRLFGVSAPLLRSAVVAGVLGAAAHNVVDSDAYLLANGLTLWCLMGLGLALSVDGVHPLLLPRGLLGVVATGLAGVLALNLVTDAVGTSIGSVAEVYKHAADEVYTEQGRAASAVYWQKALERYERALKWAPANRQYLMGAAQMLAVLGREDEAVQMAERAVASEPSAEAYVAAGRLYEAIRRPKSAEQAYRHALQRDPYSPPAQAALMSIYEQSGRTEELAELARRVASQRSSTYASVRAVPEVVERVYAEADLVLARRELVAGHHQEALRHLRRAFADYTRFMELTYPLWIARGNFAPISQYEAQAGEQGYLQTINLYLRTLGGVGFDTEQAIAVNRIWQTVDRLVLIYRENGRRKDAAALQFTVEALLRGLGGSSG
jgi:O-antigen ligase/tetratricopeptide (TPR) repeat protein